MFGVLQPAIAGCAELRQASVLGSQATCAVAKQSLTVLHMRHF